MSEREPERQPAAPETNSENEPAAPLRALYTAAYRPLQPSESLRQRVAAIVTRQDDAAARRRAWWQTQPIGWKSTAGAVAAALPVIVVGLMLVQQGRNRSSGRQTLTAVRRSPLRGSTGKVAASGGSAALERRRLSRGTDAARARHSRQISSPFLSIRLQRLAPPAVPQPPPSNHGQRIATGDWVLPRARDRERSPFTLPASYGVSRSIGNNRSRGVYRSPWPQSPGVGDLVYVNRGPEGAVQEWVPLRPDERERIEARVRRVVQVRDDFVQIPFPRLASASERQIAQAVESYKREAAIVDPRLSHEVTCAFKAIALSDLCDQLRNDTSIQLTAGSSVSDEKVTLFCEKMPLREVMRQLSRPFGYTWLRSKREGREYRYELVQDLKSQLLEEELRNRDRNAALVDMEQEAKRYRPYLELSSEAALARAATAPPEEKEILKHYAGKGWGPAQLWSRLTPADMAVLRAGQKVTFSASPGPGEQPLPPEMARNVIASLRDYHIVRQGAGYKVGPVDYVPEGVVPAAVPEAQPIVSLNLVRSELGQISLQGWSGFFIGTPPDDLKADLMGDGERYIATGISPAVRNPRNAVANAALANDPELRPRLSARPQAARGAGPSPSPAAADEAERTAGAKVTTADVLEALHRATGVGIVSDYYTRFFRPEEVSVQNLSLFDALNHLADAMRMRWRKDGKWLQLRSAGYFNDRLKEVPNRLLNRWAAARRRSGALTVEEMVEIAQLTDAQLDSNRMAEGARLLFGLVEWNRARMLRPHWRYLASFTSQQRRAAQSVDGLPFRQMSLAQQQRFLSFVLDSAAHTTGILEELSAGGLQVEYLPQVGFQLQWPQTGDAFERGLNAPRARGQTREEALRAARRLDPNFTEAQIVPAVATVTFTYRLGGANARFTPMIVHGDDHNVVMRPPQPLQANR